ncbi:MAG: DegT/DnrJ/EryC1/StrS family aminotransferase [Bacteroidetes bacterium]|nr:DegT/DnrJ/EryC1/StrS family aminotransferase [Bacteroidota bacterium]
MVPIQMVDLKRQYVKMKDEVDAAIQEVLTTTSFINGKAVGEFAHQLSAYLDAEHVIPCANGTDALQIAMMALGLEPGDEVITPSFTYIATTEVIALLRLKPVFIDVDPVTFCMDTQLLEKAITPKTKAIVPVHLYGQAANMEAIMRVANEHNLFVIEDNAQAIGASVTFSDGSVRKTGTIGHIGCTSFFPSKNLGCYGDGGAIITRNALLAERIRMVANHGQSKRYYHDVVGCNSRLDTVQAAVLKCKLPRLDAYNDARGKVAQYYSTAFATNPNITPPKTALFSTHVFHQYTLVLNGVDRNTLVDQLAGVGIPAMIYYPVPAHRQKMFSFLNLPEVDLPVTDWLTERVISLPIHTEMDQEQLDYIVHHVNQFVQ